MLSLRGESWWAAPCNRRSLLRLRMQSEWTRAIRTRLPSREESICSSKAPCSSNFEDNNRQMAPRETSLEIAAQLDEIQAPMFGRILRDTVIPTKSRANLRELDRSEFVDETPAGLLSVKCLEQRVWFKAARGLFFDPASSIRFIVRSRPGRPCRRPICRRLRSRWLSSYRRHTACRWKDRKSARQVRDD